MIKINSYLILFLSCFISCAQQNASKSETLVSTLEEFNAVVSDAKPGSVVIMANGVWKDVQLEFNGEGTAEDPIILKAEKPGGVTIEGKSSLKLGGNYLVVQDLYFTNGYTPDNMVIQFKINDLIANNSKVTNCVIENFTQPDRDTKDHWVEFWGRHNTLDHCYIAGKSNTGPTIRVFLKGNEHINNHHQITNNYFGPRPRKGGPHGETLQIGDSYTSMTPSYTNVSHNLFDHCNGEVEIISSKSNFNTFSNNVFFESEGSLVLRHGNYATIDANIFIGNENSTNIGGIRVINTGHWITNNYFYKLKGEEFRAPLAVMNGIPKSPLNRYNQVTDVVVAYNSWVDCGTPWNFGVGSNIEQREVLPASEIRSARAERMLLANNLIYNEKVMPVIKQYDSIDGIEFKNNYLGGRAENVQNISGIEATTITIAEKDKFLYVPEEKLDTVYNGFDFETIATDLFGNSREKEKRVGAIVNTSQKDEPLVDFSRYGTDWFSPKKETQDAMPISIADEQELLEALKSAESGSVLILESGDYSFNEALQINKTITIKAKDTADAARLHFKTKDKLGFRMHPEGKLKLEGLIIIGDNQEDAIGTLENNMSSAYNVFIANSHFENFKSILKSSKSSFADTIQIIKSTFKNFERGIQLAQETDDTGEYNAEFVTIQESRFENIAGTVIDYYRGGYDESTIGGNLGLTGNTFSNCGNSKETTVLIKNRGIVHVIISENTFKDNPVEYIAVLWGEKGQKPVDNIIINSGVIRVEQNIKLKLVY
ncbi:MAG: alginate lyase [Cytophagaceae bacterium]|nr:alginate lyase [Cytophagaceae bacterium]